jgi:D-alanyl-D-alanine carboxypeptidase
MTVGEAAQQTCDTGTCQGLSNQIIERLLTLAPGVMVKVTDSRLNYQSRVNMYLQPPARDSLLAALSAGGREMGIVSAYRTVAQQVMLYTWYRNGRCDISLAAPPGDSNHEDGAALDIEDSSFWRPYLTGRGWNWQGSNDPSHYSYRGSGFKDGIGSLGLEAFQLLWNEHNEDAPITVDGGYGPETEAALLASPVEGWEEMQPLRRYHNDVEQTDAIKTWLVKGNSVEDVSDWCQFSRTPVPLFDNEAKDETYAGAVYTWSDKLTCQVTTPEGICGKESAGLATIPLPGLPACTVQNSLCADHREAMALAAGPSPPGRRKSKDE